MPQLAEKCQTLAKLLAVTQPRQIPNSTLQIDFAPDSNEIVLRWGETVVDRGENPEEVIDRAITTAVKDLKEYIARTEADHKAKIDRFIELVNKTMISKVLESPCTDPHCELNAKHLWGVPGCTGERPRMVRLAE